MMLHGVELSLLGPALVAGLLVVVSHAPLGISVLTRGIIFIDLAIAQCAALGVIAASLFFPEHSEHEYFYTQVAALVAAMLGAAVLIWTEKRFSDIQEALIGCSFVLAASGALFMISHHLHGAEHIKDLLSGQILWVRYQDLLPVLVAYSVTLLLWFKAGHRLGRAGFYLIFAIIVTASVQLVGVYLVFANLIIPALAARQAKKPLAVAYAVGVIGLLTGLFLSTWLDLPTGTVIVWTLAAVGIMASQLVSRVKEGS